MDAGDVPSGAGIAGFERLTGALGRWRPGRRTAVAALVIVPALGSAIGAALGAAAGDDEQAEAVVALAGPALRDPGTREAWTRAAGVIARSGLTAVAAGEAGSLTGGPRLKRPGEVERRTKVTVSPAAGTVQITARGPSAPAAVALADALAAQTALVGRSLVLGDDGDGRVVLGDFEDGLGYWALPPVQFNAPPALVRRTTAVARFGHASLRATCDPTVGCGPSTRVHHLFRPGTTYTASVWVRVRPPKPVHLVIGSAPDDNTTTPATVVGPRWRRLVARWTPKRRATLAAVAVQLPRPDRSTVWADGALLFDPTLSPPLSPAVVSPGREAKILDSAASVVVSPAAVTGSVSDDVPAWAAAGAAIALAAATAAVAVGAFAQRRRQG